MDLFPRLKQAITDRRFKWFVLGVIFFVSLDLATKYWAEKVLIKEYAPGTVLEEGEYLQRLFPDKKIYVLSDVKVMAPYWLFSYVRNLDIGFSLLRFTDRWFSQKGKVLFVRLLQLSAIAIMCCYFLYHRYEYFIPFTLIIGGGFGNVIDRFYRGYVVDFIRWEWPGSPFDIFKPWPVFNLADSFVSVGGVTLLLIILWEGARKKNDSGSGSDRAVD